MHTKINLKKKAEPFVTFFFALYLCGLWFVLAGLAFNLFIFLKDNLNKLEYSVNYFIGGIALTIALASFLVNYYKNFLDDEKREKLGLIFRVMVNGLVFSLMSFILALVYFLTGSADNGFSKSVFYLLAFASGAIFSLCFILLLIFFSMNFYRDWKELNKEIKHNHKRESK